MANFHEQSTLNGSVEQVIQVFASQDFAQQLSQRAGAELTSFNIDGDVNGAFTLTAVRAAGTDRVPDFAKKFVGDKVQVTQIENWEAPDANGNRKATVQVQVAGAPASISGTETLVANGETTDYTIDGDLNVSIPLVGNKIAAKATPAAGKVFAVQTQLINNNLQ
ncbi:MAG: DUF2505 domain-containing protein [Micrococcaceae bacterium]